MIFNCVCKCIIIDELSVFKETNGFPLIAITGASSLLAAVRAQQDIANQQAGHSSIEGPAKVVKSESLESSMLLLQPQVSRKTLGYARPVRSFRQTNSLQL